MAHSHLSPSAAGRWTACPGSVALSANIPPEPSSVHAAEGTVAHDLAYQLLTGKTSHAKLLERVGETVMESDHEIEITEEMVDGAKVYHDAVFSIVKEMRARNKPSVVTMKAEEKVRATSVDIDLFGTADCIVFQKGAELVVVDYKYGKGVPVEVKGNKQMTIYAIGAMDSVAMSRAFDRIRLVIVQPRAPHADGPVRTAEVTKEEIEAAVEELQEAVKATRAPSPKVVAGSHCRWCPAKSVCPALLTKAQEVARADFAVEPTVAALPDVASLTMDQALNALQWEDTLIGFFKAIRARLEHELNAGKHIPGWKLVEGKSNRVWMDEGQVEKELGALFGDEIYAPRKVKSPAQAEKLVGKGKIDHLTMKPAGKIVMVEESDPRPAVLPSSAPETDFTALLPEMSMEKDTKGEPKNEKPAEDINDLNGLV